MGLPCFLLFLPGLMSLLGMASCHVGPLGFYLFPWALMTHLPCFYFLLHSCACWPVRLLPLSSGPYGPFALLLPLTIPVGLLTHWAFTSFFGPSWPICFAFISFFGLSWPVCFAFTFCCACGPTYYHFLPCWPIRLFFSFFLFWGFVAHLLLFWLFHSFFYFLFLAIRPFCCWALFIKNGYQHSAS